MGERECLLMVERFHEDSYGSSDVPSTVVALFDHIDQMRDEGEVIVAVNGIGSPMMFHIAPSTVGALRILRGAAQRYETLTGKVVHWKLGEDDHA